MTIRVVNERDADGWDDFIKLLPSSGPFHTRAWTECFKSERLTPHYLRLLSNDQPIGAIAGVVVDPDIPVLRGIDRKLSFFSGPALSKMNSALIRDCMLSLNRYAQDQGFTSLISSGRDYPYSYNWGHSKVHLQTIQEMIIDLREPWEHIKERMRKSVPEQARKAERSGLTFHETRDASMLAQLLCLLENTKLRNKTKRGASFSPYYIPHLAEKSLSCLSESSIARFFVSRRGSEVLCVLLVFAFSKRAYALLIGCSDEGYRLRAPAFVWFNAIRNLKAAGAESLNLAGGNAFAKISLGAEGRTCTGSVSPYLKGPVRNLLFQTYRWVDNLIESAPLFLGKS
ncbi:MAG: GNAT family N-acetyltransferase [Thiobacillaceae bacterium]